MRTTKTKKKKRTTSKSKRQKIIDQFDAIFSRYIRMRDSDDKGIVTCPLCWKKLPRKKAQNMHFIKRGVLKYRFDEDNCHAGCKRCNVMLDWNYIEYTRRMQRKYGIKKVDEMIYDKQPYDISTPELEDMMCRYRGKLDNYAYKFILNINENGKTKRKSDSDDKGMKKDIQDR